MRIWFVFFAVGIIVLLGCGSSQDTEMSASEAIGLVQGELRKFCLPTKEYLKKTDLGAWKASPNPQGEFFIVKYGETAGTWHVYPSGFLESKYFISSKCR
mgnify:CR=1 FL=1